MDDCDPPYLSAAFARLGPQARNRIRRRCLRRNRRALASLSGAMAALGLAVEMKALFQVIRLTQTATLATQKRHSSGRVMVLTWSA